MSKAVIQGVAEGLDRFRQVDPDHSVYRAKTGLTRQTVEDISYQKG